MTIFKSKFVSKQIYNIILTSGGYIFKSHFRSSPINTSNFLVLNCKAKDYKAFCLLACSGVPRNFVRGRGGSANSVEDGGQRERGSGGGNPLVRGSAQFANE
jgi:hypothetical protein